MEYPYPPFVDRKTIAIILSEHGFKTAPATLAKLAVVGGGPEFIKFGRAVLYSPQTAIAWAKNRAVVCRSTSDVGIPLETETEEYNKALLSDLPKSTQAWGIEK
jgi:hypothetical protein